MDHHAEDPTKRTPEKTPAPPPKDSEEAVEREDDATEQDDPVDPGVERSKARALFGAEQSSF